MCGIAGFLNTQPLRESELASDCRGMARALAHRGPDDAGTWHDAGAGIALVTAGSP